MKRSNVSSALIMVSASVTWGSFGVLSQFIHWDPLSQAIGRNLLCALMLAIYIGITRQWAFRWEKHVIAGSIFGGLCNMLFLLSMGFTSPATTVAIFYISPVFNLIIALARERRPPKYTELVWLTLAMAGLYFVARSDFDAGNEWGVIFAVLSGVCWVVAIEVSHVISPKETLTIATWGNAATGLAFIPLALFLGTAVPTLEQSNWMMILSIGNVLAYLLWAKSVSKVKPQVSAIISVIEVPVSMLLTWLLVNKPLTGDQVVGAVLIMIAATGTILTQKEKKKDSTPVDKPSP